MIFPQKGLAVTGTIILGALSIWLGFPNDFIDAPVLVLLWPCCLAFLGTLSTSGQQAFTRSWFSSFLGTSAALYWLALPMHLVGGLPLAAAFACALAVSACLATSGGLFGLMAHHCRHSPPLLLAGTLALTWCALELLYSLIAGFPWLPVSGALVVWPSLVQGAAFLGAHGIAALWIFAGLSIFLALPGIHGRTISIVPFFLGISCIGLMAGHGLFVINQNDVIADNDAHALPVLFVEGNVDQAQKWIPAFQRATLERYVNLTQQGLEKHKNALLGKRPLIVWPETAMPYFFGHNAIFDKMIRDVPRLHQSALLFGSPAEDASAPRLRGEPPVYNRAWLLGADGEIAGFYDKEHLVPFGEYIPEFFNISFLEGLLQEVGMYTPGSAVAPLPFQDASLGMLICYEGIFPWLAQNRVDAGANLLVDISNDGWFLKTPAARQHLYLTALRAIEQGRDIIRGTNTGISAVIDANGRIIWRGSQFQSTSHLAWAQIRTSRTIYNQIWFWLWPCGLFLLVTLLVVSIKVQKENS